MLSRQPRQISKQEERKAEEMEKHIIRAVKEYPASSEFIDAVKKETGRCEEMSQLKSKIQNGWPNKQHDCRDKTERYWPSRTAYSAIDGLVFHNERVVIPPKLRKKALDSLHQGHITYRRMQQRAKGTIFWPGISNDIAQYESGCEICRQNARRNPKQPLIWNKESTYPTQRIGVDVAEIDQEKWLIIIDDYSGLIYPEKIRHESASEVIGVLTKWCTQNGIPENLCTDNGTCFTSQKFTEFTQRLGIKVKYAAPYHQQANGLAEMGVKRFKKLRRGNKGDKFIRAVLTENNTPKDDKPSPSELFFNREMRDGSAQWPSGMRRKEVDHTKFMANRERKHENAKEKYDRTTRDMKEIDANRPISSYDHITKKWRPARYIKQIDERNYSVELESGRTAIRNRRDLRNTEIQRKPENEEIIIDWEEPKDPNEDQQQQNQQPPIQPNGQQQQQQVQQGRPKRSRKPPNRYGEWTK
jgi:transposase InsO family protein